MMNKETIDTLMLVATLTMFVGGPTTLAAGFATRLAIRGGIALGRRLAVGAISGAVATTAAFIYMNAQGGEGDGGVPGFPGIKESDLAVEVFTLSYELDDTGAYFELNDDGAHLSQEDTKHLIAQAKEHGKTKEIRIIDRAQAHGGAVIKIRNFTQSLGLDFTMTEELPIQEEVK